MTALPTPQYELDQGEIRKQRRRKNQPVGGRGSVAAALEFTRFDKPKEEFKAAAISPRLFNQLQELHDECVANSHVNRARFEAYTRALEDQNDAITRECEQILSLPYSATTKRQMMFTVLSKGGSV